MDPGIRHHPALADSFPPRFELRFYEKYRLSRRMQNFVYPGKNMAKGDEGGVHTAKPRGFIEIRRLEMTGIGALHDHYLWAGTEFPGKLSIPHIHRIDPGGSVCQKNFRKASRGSTDIETAEPLHGERKDLKGLEKFMGSPTYPLFFLHHPKIHVFGKLGAAFVNTLPFHKNFSPQNERLRPAP